MDLTTKTTAGRDADSSDNGGKFGGQPRHHRRLTKWEKTRDDDALEGGSEVLSSDQDEGSLLYQSLKAMETHLLEKPEDEILDNSSEKDVYLQDGSATGMGGGSAAEQDSDEDEDANEEDGEEEKSNFMMEGNMGGGAQNGMTKEKSDVHMNAIKLQQLKQTHHHHHNHQQQTTTPKGLTTWSAVGSGGIAQQPMKGTVQKVSMADFTVSSPVGFSTQSTNKPITTANIITKDKMTEMPTMTTMAPTTTTTSVPMTTMTMPPVTVQTSNIVAPTKHKRRPQNTKKPTKYVRPALDEVTATQIGSDETHNVYVLKPVQETESKTATPDLMATYTKQPWPFMTTKKAPFSKIRTTARPIKNAYAKRTQTPKLTLTTPMTTTKPSTSTVYYRRPAGGFVHPIIPVSFSNLSFMDYIRTQIVPKIGLSMISFIATSPLILTMLGAVGRKKRDLSEVTGKSAAAAQDWKFTEDLETMASKWEYQMKSSTPSSMLNGYDDHKKPNKRNKIRSKKNPY